jgi:hypothetical protein
MDTVILPKPGWSQGWHWCGIVLVVASSLQALGGDTPTPPCSLNCSSLEYSCVHPSRQGIRHTSLQGRTLVACWLFRGKNPEASWEGRQTVPSFVSGSHAQTLAESLESGAESTDQDGGADVNKPLLLGSTPLGRR